MEQHLDTYIEQELQSSYLDYAMSVIVGRALPDARDGLKPAQRRILYAMYKLNNVHNQPTKKSARIVGEVIGKYHPHGDVAAYETLIRMAQWFSMNHRLVEGQGNMGCFTKETKIKLSDGRDIDFEQLIDEQSKGKRHWAFTFNTQIHMIEIAEVKSPRLTRTNAELVEVELDSGKKIKCTPDHRFMLHSGEYRQAKDLEAGDSLAPLYTKAYDGIEDKNLKNYDMVLQQYYGEWQFIHHLADEWNLSKKVYAKSRGRIRHHLDFNKKNNNPDNIMRVDWKEHWEIHYKHASWRHKHDKEYVRKLAEGRRKYIEENHELFSKRLSERNRRNWKNPHYRKLRSEAIKRLWKKEGYREKMGISSSNRLKKLWQNKEFQQLMSKIKSGEMKERWKNRKYRSHMRQMMKEASLKLWSNPQHRQHISTIMKKLSADPEWIRRQSKIARGLWKNEAYRAKFGKDHFSKMSRIAWSHERTRLLHKERAKKQWQDPAFRSLIVNYTRGRGLARIKENPELMKQLAQLAKNSLHKKWRDHSYKQRVIRSKILGYTSSLLSRYTTVTPEIYESERKNNCIPRVSKALDYFSNFEQIVIEAKTYNHKVTSVIFLKETQDVYDLTVAPWHNFALSADVFVHNSIDGDPPAAQRYTEVRLERIAEEMLEDIEKQTVQMVANFDNTEEEPLVLPGKVPNLMLNGASGIAVGVATSIMPHNLSELCNAIFAYIENREILPVELMEHIKGPDFPTGGQVFYNNALVQSYITGNGSAIVRAKTMVEKVKQREAIILTEMPYMVNKAAMVEQIANLVRNRKLQGISDIRDESGKEGIRVVIELRSDANAEFVLNQLYKHTQLQTTMPVMNVAVMGNRLMTLNIKQMVKIHVDHRLDVIKKRTEYDKNIALDRRHIVQGLLIAIQDIDNVVNIIKKSADVKDAKAALMEKYSISEKQAAAILDMRLSRLTSLENVSLEKELAQLNTDIARCEKILSDENEVYQIIKQELGQIKSIYGKKRKTEMIRGEDEPEITNEDLVKDEEVTIILTKNNYMKRMDAKLYREQDRGGRGARAIQLKEGDFVRRIIYCMSKDYVLVLTNKGRAYWLKAYQIPEEGKYSSGKAAINLVKLSEGENIEEMINTRVFANSYLTLITKAGKIKRMNAEKFSHPRANGIRAISLESNDNLVDVCLSDGHSEFLIATKQGTELRFKETDIRPVGRTARGIRGIRLDEGDAVVNIIAAKQDQLIASITERGYGKVTELGSYRLQRRGGKGVIGIRLKDKTGHLVRALSVSKDDHLLIINSAGVSIKFVVSEIRQTGRAASGVHLMRLDAATRVVDAQIIGSAATQQPKVDKPV